MEFGKVALTEALGCILAHTTRVRGQVIHKGTILDVQALQRLRSGNQMHVTAARLAPHDVGENEAACQLSQALLAAPGVQGLVASRPANGRVNITASHAGLFRADRLRIDALNTRYEGITVATLADATPAEPGDLVATIKIIPFAVPAGPLADAEAVANGLPALRVAQFRPLRTGLVVTAVPGMKDSILVNTIGVTQGRVERLGGSLLPPLRVAHAPPPIAAAISRLLPGVDLLLIAGASAVMDRKDVAPSAIVAAGGTIEQFGMPVDPGNLICLGSVGAVPVLVLPGCARSPAFNGIDFLLHRIFAGEPAGADEVTRMGVGGLLKGSNGGPISR